MRATQMMLHDRSLPVLIRLVYHVRDRGRSLSLAIDQPQAKRVINCIQQARIHVPHGTTRWEIPPDPKITATALPAVRNMQSLMRLHLHDNQIYGRHIRAQHYSLMIKPPAHEVVSWRSRTLPKACWPQNSDRTPLGACRTWPPFR